MHSSSFSDCSPPIESALRESNPLIRSGRPVPMPIGQERDDYWFR